MKFNVSPNAYSAVFSMPCEAVDKHIKLAGAVQLKVLLAAFRNVSFGIDSDKIAEMLSIPKADVEDSLRYWVSAGLLTMPDAEVTVSPKTEEKKGNVRAAVRPTREEVAQRGFEDEQVAFLLREAQNKFGRGLKTSEASTLLWLYDDEGMSVALIIMLLEYAVSENCCNVRFVERTATEWLKAGVTDIVSAEKQIAEAAKRKTAWRIVENAFGLERRQPSKAESETAYKWVNEWGMTRELLRAAYDACVDTTSHFSMQYIKKIIDEWHKAGVKTVDDIPERKSGAKRGKESFAAYDIDDVEKMLNSDD